MKRYNCITANELQLHRIVNSSGIEFAFLPGGGLYEINHGSLMLNLYSGSAMEPGPANIYLRLHSSDGIEFTPLLNGEASYSDNSIAVEGSFKGVTYRVEFLLSDKDDTWFWKITLNSAKNGIRADLIYVQDIGITDRDAIKRNEYYTSQYLDQNVLDHPEYGPVLCTRQNLAQNNKFPFIMSGCCNGAKAFLTDGIQFYGLSYKATGIPEALIKTELESVRKQHEFSCHVLASEIYELNSEQENEIVFFSTYIADHSEISSPADLMTLSFPPLTAKNVCSKAFPYCPTLFSESKLFSADTLNKFEISKYFGTERKHEEFADEQLLSFFVGRSYVVTKAKELLCERPHGHILRNCTSIFPDEKVASATVWMNGVFNSHLTFGNTSFFKYLGVSRGAFNFLRSSGIRIFVKDADEIELLGMPSAFRIDLHSCTWIYKCCERTIIVNSWFDSDSLTMITDIEVSTGSEAEFIITAAPIMGDAEYKSEIICEISEKQLRFKTSVDDNELIIAVLAGKCRIKDDEAIFSDKQRRLQPYAAMVTNKTSKFTFSCGLEMPGEISLKKSSYVAEQFWNGLLNERKISNCQDSGITRFDAILPWFVHNAMVHFATPYGLEQYSGAAWGVRDICQGPIELFSSLGRHDVNKKILKKVFSHQYINNGLWPQWFMFDKNYKCQQAHCHGDVAIWPLKALCEYIETSGDFSILDEKIPYTDDNYEYTAGSATISEHIERMIKSLTSSFIKGTALVCYGGGDWNDSLQPLDDDATSNMVSSWTVELVYQTLNRYVKVLDKLKKDTSSLLQITAAVKNDFNKYLVKDDITAGFGSFENHKVKLMLHPDDKDTGIKYRLLPAVRGIISNIFTPEQAENHYEMIREQLLLPDGAHLMDLPAEYTGGISHHFQRAETASFFGREVGTNYIHAHLRYCEAMAKLGKADDLYEGLLMANPVALKEIVPNADIRQSNCYFSSSDADFNNRYDARNKYDLFKKGKIKANGGWRIYSSGPGIYVNILLNRFLGLRSYFDKFIFDPVIPASLKYVKYHTEIDNKKVICEYNMKKESHSPKEIRINGNKFDDFEYSLNPYRKGGIMLDRKKLSQLLKLPENIIELST